MVLQDTWLFGGTIRDNIAYGSPDATEERDPRGGAGRPTSTGSCAALPDGYDTVIDDEAATSAPARSS